MAIKNQANLDDPGLLDVRQALEHRATWFYFLLDEARKRGIDWEDLGRDAIFRCGTFHGGEKFPGAETVEEFSLFFPGELAEKIFEMKIVKNPPHHMEITFHYCPLVAAWQRLGIDEAEIGTLCDMAMEGDRGIIASFPKLEMELGETIAGGADRCRLTIWSKE